MNSGNEAGSFSYTGLPASKWHTKPWTRTFSIITALVLETKQKTKKQKILNVHIQKNGGISCNILYQEKIIEDIVEEESNKYNKSLSNFEIYFIFVRNNCFLKAILNILQSSYQDEGIFHYH